MKTISIITSISSILFFSIFSSAAFACTTPAILDTNGAFICPIHWCSFDGELLIDRVNYPDSQYSGVKIINYTIQIQNFDEGPETVYLQPSSSIANYVSGLTINVPALSKVNAMLQVWIYGESVQGTIGVFANCVNGPLIVPMTLKARIVGKQYETPPGPMPNTTTSTTSPTTSTTTTTQTTSTTSATTTTTTTTPTTSSTTTTTTTPGNQVTLLNAQGCTFSQFYCPTQYYYCSYNFNSPIPRTTINCDMWTVRSNPGTIQPGNYLCPAYSSNGFSSTTTCQLYGILSGSSTTTTTQTTSSTTTTTTTPSATTTTTPTTSSTTTTTTSTSQPPSNIILDSNGCQFGQIVCPANYQSCSYQFTKTAGTINSVSCDMWTVRSNPGTLNSGESLCPAYDNSKGYSSSVRCQLFGNSGTTTTTSQSTPSTTTTTTTQTQPSTSTTTTTTTSPENPGTVLINKFGCSFPEIKCPSNFAFCEYAFTGRIVPITSVNCDLFTKKTNPGILNSGESLCPPYDTNGYSNSVNCTLVGYGTASQQNIFTSLLNTLGNSISQLIAAFLAVTINIS